MCAYVLKHFSPVGLPWCAWFRTHELATLQCRMPTDLGAVPPLLHLSELKAAVLLLAAVWLLVPFTLKLIRAISAGRKLRHLPGPRGGLVGVTPILRVRMAVIYLSCKAQLRLLGNGSLSHNWKDCIVCYAPVHSDDLLDM